MTNAKWFLAIGISLIVLSGCKGEQSLGELMGERYAAQIRAAQIRAAKPHTEPRFLLAETGDKIAEWTPYESDDITFWRGSKLDEFHSIDIWECNYCDRCQWWVYSQGQSGVRHGEAVDFFSAIKAAMSVFDEITADGGNDQDEE